MKNLRTPKLIRSLAAVVGGFALFIPALQAAPFLYGPGDLVLAFRQTGNASDYAVNLGKATNYNNLPINTTIAITNLSVAQLNSAFPSLNELKWSVAAANRPPVNGNYPLQTLWLSRPRLDPDVQSAPWLRKGSFSQGTAGAQIDGVGVNAAQSSSLQTAGPNNTATGVVIPVASEYNLGLVIGDSGNYVNTYQGNVESISAADFDSDPANVSRADLYELLPGSLAGGTLDAPGRYLGYFEFKPDGSLTFNTTTPPLPRPTITSIVRNGDLTTVSFTTVSSATYRLRHTDAAGLNTSVTNWAIGDTTQGDGAVKSLQYTSSDVHRFFAVDAQR